MLRRGQIERAAGPGAGPPALLHARPPAPLPSAAFISFEKQLLSSRLALLHPGIPVPPSWYVPKQGFVEIWGEGEAAKMGCKGVMQNWF